MKLYGLIGKTLAHSFSAEYFYRKFIKENIAGCRYDLFPLQSLNELDGLIRNNPQLKGFNVTIPFKKTIIPLLDQVDETAREVQAVNTVCIFRKGDEYWLKGFNTDVYGFKNSFEIPGNIHKAIILGTGGAAKAVAWSLTSMRIGYLFVSRNLASENSICYDDLKSEDFYEYQLIINTTPLGMYPDVDSYPPIPYQFIRPGNILYDLVYNPEITCFLRFGMERGAKVLNGLRMLELQAEESWKIWKSADYESF